MLVHLNKQEDRRLDVQNDPAPESHIEDVPLPLSCDQTELDNYKGDCLVVLELCAGSAILSAILKREGFDTIPIDFMGNRHRPHMHVLSMDLRLESTWRFLEYAVVTRTVLHVHCGPPCGTCSRARGIILDDGSAGPQPLRDESFPLGFPFLKGNNLERVQSANLVYLQMAKFVRWLNSLGIGFSIENPTNSLLWHIGEYKQLLDIAFFVHFDACMHGSSRLKHTSFLTNVPELASLAISCDGRHEHQPWGMLDVGGDKQFATSQEAAYPKQLCESISDCLKLRAASLGFDVDSMILPSDSKAKMAAQTQPRRKAGPPIVSEYKYTQTVSSAELPSLDHKKQLLKPFCNVPLHSKLLRQVVKKGESAPEFCYTFGIFRDPWEFVNEAKMTKHPFDTTCFMPDSMLKTMCAILEKGPLEVMKSRIGLLQTWSAWEKQLRRQEKLLHESMPPSVAQVLQGKNLLLLQRVATELGWPDQNIHDDIKSGFRLTGNPLPSGIFQLDFKPATMEEGELMSKMSFMKHALWAKVHNQPEQEFSVALWDITMEECNEKQWLRGPLSWEELEEKYHGMWLPCRRFAVWQSSKWRPIDDFTENAVNSTYTVCERIQLRAMDETIWVASVLMRFARDKGYFKYPLEDGSYISGSVHESWCGSHKHDRPLVKTMDLKSAYKQWAIAPSDISKAILVLKNPNDDNVYGFECLTLPFGSISSVVCFNRIARLYQRILHECLILAANYFDDYPIVEYGQLAASTEHALKSISSLFGFKVSSDKEQPFAECADMLGVTLDLSDPTLSSVKVSNKKSRVEDMAKSLQLVLDQGTVMPSTMPSLFGRLQFCEGQLLGRQGRLALADLRSLERSKERMVKITEEQKLAVGIFVSDGQASVRFS